MFVVSVFFWLRTLSVNSGLPPFVRTGCLRQWPAARDVLEAIYAQPPASRRASHVGVSHRRASAILRGEWETVQPRRRQRLPVSVSKPSPCREWCHRQTVWRFPSQSDSKDSGRHGCGGEGRTNAVGLVTPLKKARSHHSAPSIGEGLDSRQQFVDRSKNDVLLPKTCSTGSGGEVPICSGAHGRCLVIDATSCGSRFGKMPLPLPRPPKLRLVGCKLECFDRSPPARRYDARRGYFRTGCPIDPCRCCRRSERRRGGQSSLIGTLIDEALKSGVTVDATTHIAECRQPNGLKRTAVVIGVLTKYGLHRVRVGEAAFPEASKFLTTPRTHAPVTVGSMFASLIEGDVPIPPNHSQVNPDPSRHGFPYRECGHLQQTSSDVELCQDVSTSPLCQARHKQLLSCSRRWT